MNGLCKKNVRSISSEDTIGESVYHSPEQESCQLFWGLQEKIPSSNIVKDGSCNFFIGCIDSKVLHHDRGIFSHFSNPILVQEVLV